MDDKRLWYDIYYIAIFYDGNLILIHFLVKKKVNCFFFKGMWDGEKYKRIHHSSGLFLIKSSIGSMLLFNIFKDLFLHLEMDSLCLRLIP